MTSAILADCTYYHGCSVSAKKYLEEVFGETGIGTDNYFGEGNSREVNKVCGSICSIEIIPKNQANSRLKGNLN